MKKLIVVFMFLAVAFSVNAQSWIRVNEVGYLPHDIKVAVLLSTNDVDSDFFVRDSKSDEIVYSGKGAKANPSKWGMKSAYRLDFSSLKNEGGYYIESNGVKSVPFCISAGAYDGIADYLLTYMRQQRCGDNPFNGVPCHTDDGYIVDHPSRSGEKIDVTGGWHDATDYLQYLTTSATACYHLLFAYMMQIGRAHV